MRSLPRPAALYIAAVIAVGAAVLTRAVWNFPRDEGAVFAGLLFAALATLADLRQLDLGYGASYSVATAVNFSAAIVFGLPVAVCVGAISSLAGDLHKHKSPYKIAFNACTIAISIAAGGTFLAALKRTGSGLIGPQDLPALAGYVAANILVNNTLVFVAIGLATRTSPWEVAAASFRGLFLPVVALFPLGILVAVSYVYFGGVIGLVLLIVPTMAVYGALNRSQQLREHTRAAIEALADAIDRRDRYTAQHSLRVAEYAGKVAAVLGLTLHEREVLVSAARVHDLGKISTPDEVLRKPGKLTDDEWGIMRLHPQTGAAILEKLPMYRDHAKLVGSHHERLDGLGYPSKLAGNNLPLSTQILSVADAFDAMTSDRPYRPAMARSTAIAHLRQGGGSQFDKRVVEALARALGIDEPREADAAIRNVASQPVRA